MKNATVLINHQEVPVNGERNLLELIRKANVDLPTFCYHSDLSIYGACRLCLVEVEGRGTLPACSTPPEAGMVIHTHTADLREMRRIIVELLLANHDSNCPTCPKNNACQLQSLASKLGITRVRFKPTKKSAPVDDSSRSLVRDPDKCVLCGDCVRMCSEIQGIGAIDFAHRGSQVAVLPAFAKDLAHVECVNCGQCAKVCPTGALTPKSEVSAVWADIYNQDKVVVVQVAPAVRVALGEQFGCEPGVNVTGQMVAALRRMGFDKVYDTSFTADLTVIEETNEFLGRFAEKKRLPLLTSCCPAWVKFVEQYFPQMLPNLSSCKSPQQMFGSVAKKLLPKQLNTDSRNLTVVSVMPCTAKKFEAKREEFAKNGYPEVDHVLTTQELARMIAEAGLDFKKLEPESFDLPLGFKTGAGIIFGNTGGVSEAVLRYASEKLSGQKLDTYEFLFVRGPEGVREAEVDLAGVKLRLAVVHSLGNARKLLQAVERGEARYDFIEVMACPGGCIGGAGQPVARRSDEINARRTRGLYDIDKTLKLHKSQDNPHVEELYAQHLKSPGSKEAHAVLHTGYRSRRRIDDIDLPILSPSQAKLKVSVCVGTSCYLRGSQNLLHKLIKHMEDNDLTPFVEVEASFCFEQCSEGPSVSVGGEVLKHCTFEVACAKIKEKLAAADSVPERFATGEAQSSRG